MPIEKKPTKPRASQKTQPPRAPRGAPAKTKRTAGAAALADAGYWVLAVAGLEALREHRSAAREFPAEDTPAEPPAEVERLLGSPVRPVRA